MFNETEVITGSLQKGYYAAVGEEERLRPRRQKENQENHFTFIFFTSSNGHLLVTGHTLCKTFSPLAPLQKLLTAVMRPVLRLLTDDYDWTA